MGKRGSGSGLGIIRLGSAEKTELGLDIKHRPGLREDKLGRKWKGTFRLIQENNGSSCRYSRITSPVGGEYTLILSNATNFKVLLMTYPNLIIFFLQFSKVLSKSNPLSEVTYFISGLARRLDLPQTMVSLDFKSVWNLHVYWAKPMLDWYQTHKEWHRSILVLFWGPWLAESVWGLTLTVADDGLFKLGPMSQERN